jgi:nucleoside-diphosphate-sugar epimerase
MSRQKVLISGSTGFVGSALAAYFLAHDVEVIALSRNDPNGKRARDAIVSASHGSGFPLHTAQLGSLSHAMLDEERPDLGLSDGLLADITDVWHCAAEMSLSGKRLGTAFMTNVGLTCDLYRRFSTSGSACRRFYYCSTAYVCGMSGGKAKEELHFNGHCTTSYIATKRHAELCLAWLHTQHSLPVTLFRPTIVIGDERTGWTVVNGFGFYMFIEIAQFVKNAEQKQTTLRFRENSALDLLPINRLTEAAHRLTTRDALHSEMEIFHISGGKSIRVGDAMSLAGGLCGIEVAFGTPCSNLDKELDHALALKLPFANMEWISTAITSQPRSAQPSKMICRRNPFP